MSDWSLLPSGFHWMRPWWGAAGLPLLLLWWRLWWTRRAGGEWLRLGDPQLLAPLLIGNPARTPHWPLWLLAAGWLLALIALAGPVWVQEPQPLFNRLHPLVVALDLSASMMAGDVAPSRLERAKQKIRDAAARGRPVGLVVFAGDAYPVVPLTEDANTLAALLPALTPELMPEPGSRPARAIAAAAKLLDQSGTDPGLVLLLTDGDAHPAESFEAARALRKPGHRLAVLGVGTAEGAPIPLPKGGFYRNPQGHLVLPALQDPPLRELAAAGGGDYAALTADDTDLDRLLHWPAGHQQIEVTSHTAPRWREEGPWLLPPLLLLAALAFRRGWLKALVLLGLLAPADTSALAWEELWQRPDQQGASALAMGDPATAAARFQDPAWRGTALYQSGRYLEAAQAFAEAEGPTARFNQGNALARAGKLAAAATAYQQALALDPHHQDAAHNLELVKKAAPQHPDEKKQESTGTPPEKPPGTDQHSPPSATGDDQPRPPSAADQDHQSGAGSSPPAAPGSAAPESAAPGSAAPSQPGPATEAPPATDPDPATTAAQEPPKPVAESELAALQRAYLPGGESRPDPARPADAIPREESLATEERESRQATEQWLRRLPDDPGGLLRRKFRLEHQRRRAATPPLATRPEEPW